MAVADLARRLLAGVLITDGLITVGWGSDFLRWQRRLAPDWYRPLLDALLAWPEWALRLGAAAEAALGGFWLICHLRERRR